MTLRLEQFSLDRVLSAVEKVRQRLLRATRVLEGAGIPYAVAEGNAVALWAAFSFPLLFASRASGC